MAIINENKPIASAKAAPMKAKRNNLFSTSGFLAALDIKAANMWPIPTAAPSIPIDIRPAPTYFKKDKSIKIL